ncbi:MAG: restriction endonuclease subunit S [Oscillospiraceae bacterium]|nr:restriction endonuclease subunit S [Oscillospiraceae bacterium]
MAEWKEMMVGDLCDTISDTYHRNDAEVVLVNTSDVLEGKILNHQAVENKNLKGQFKKTFRKDDILYSEIRPANKRYAYVDFEETDCYIASTKLMVLRPKIDKVLPRFLFAFLSSNHVLMELQHLAETRSGTFPQITFSSELAPMPITVPDFKTQEKIVCLLSSIEGKIQNNSTINENLLQQSEAIYKAWFCGHSSLNKSSPWQKTTIGELTSLVVRGITPKYNDDSNQLVINQKCIRNHIVDLTPARRHLPKAITEKWLIKGDLLINSTGEGTLGRVAQVWFSPNNLTVDSHVTIVRPKSAELSNYIGLWGLTHEAEIESLHTGSTGQTELPRERVKAMELPLPDETTLSRFNELITPMTQAIVKNQQENIHLAELRDSLLPQLISGKLDVSDLDI